jgi:hypothetical protein
MSGFVNMVMKLQVNESRICLYLLVNDQLFKQYPAQIR